MILHFYPLVLLLNQKNTQNTHFVHTAAIIRSMIQYREHVPDSNVFIRVFGDDVSLVCQHMILTYTSSTCINNKYSVTRSSCSDNSSKNSYVL